jgi:hypothetical protein
VKFLISVSATTTSGFSFGEENVEACIAPRAHRYKVPRRADQERLTEVRFDRWHRNPRCY